MFNFVTDYVALALFSYKLYIGVRYVVNLIWVGEMDEEFLMENQLLGNLKWEARIKRRQRKWLQSYYMVSIIYQRYSMFQGLSLIWIFTDKLIITLKILFMIVFSLMSYFYMIPKMYVLLD